MRIIIAYAASFLVVALIGWFIYFETRFLDAEKTLLGWLRAHPRWHYGLDIVATGIVSRFNVYIYLERLREKGLVERMEGPIPDHPGLARALFRATPNEAL